VAGDEYLDDMAKARIGADGTCTWVEVCFCATPLQEERPYWEKYFDLIHIKDAHARKNCRDANGTEPWALLQLRLHQQIGGAITAYRRQFSEILESSYAGSRGKENRMPRILPLEREETTGEARAIFDRELARFGRLTNMKRTLLPLAFGLPRSDGMVSPSRHHQGFFGCRRLAIIFAHAISSEGDCPDLHYVHAPALN
jgi:hypothetical protein